MIGIFIRATPRRRWNRNIVFYALNGLYDLADFKKLGYSIMPPHPMAHRKDKQIGLNITFKSEAAEKEFMRIGLTKLLWSQLEEVCQDGLIVHTSDDSPWLTTSAKLHTAADY